jgi:hypothetical protein
MEIIPTNPALQALQAEWKKAKEAEKQWNAYRLKIEEQITTQMEQLGYDFPVKGTLSLDAGIDLGFGLTRKWSQPCLGQVIVLHPELLQSMFKIEYKPVSNPMIDGFIAKGGTLAAEISGCYEDKPKKVAFSARS